MIRIDAHKIISITLEPEFRFESGNREVVSRDLVLLFEGGSTYKIECYAANSELKVEVK